MLLPRFLRLYIHSRQQAVLPATLTRRRIYILPTRSGLVFALMLLAMLLAAINYTNNLAFLLTFVLGSVWIVSSLHAYVNLVGLTLVQIRQHPAWCGQDARLTLTLQSGGRARRMLLLETGEASASHSLVAGMEGEADLFVPTLRRGRMELGQIVVSTRYPLGLFRAWSPLRLPVSGLVYPRPLDTPLRDWMYRCDGHDEGSGVAGQSGEFKGIRTYRPEDGLSRVAWKSSARGQGLMAKEYGSSHGQTVFFDWGQMTDGDYEERISRMAGLVRDAERTGLRYGLRLPGAEFSPSSGAGHAHRCLEALALMPEVL